MARSRSAGCVWSSTGDGRGPRSRSVRTAVGRWAARNTRVAPALACSRLLSPGVTTTLSRDRLAAYSCVRRSVRTGCLGGICLPFRSNVENASLLVTDAKSTRHGVRRGEDPDCGSLRLDSATLQGFVVTPRDEPGGFVDGRLTSEPEDLAPARHALVSNPVHAHVNTQNLPGVHDLYTPMAASGSLHRIVR